MSHAVRRGATYCVIAAALIAPWEGLLTTAQPDALAGGIPQVCYGMTSYDRPVKLGDTYTPQQCMDFLIGDIPKYRKPIEPCIHVNLTNHQWAAAISLAYNVGPGAVCRSTFVRRLNAGDPRACDSLLLFDRAGGHVVQGLVNRRRAERVTCYTKD